MLIILNLNTQRNDIDNIKNKIIEYNCTPHEIPGERKLAIGITGPTNTINEEEIRKMKSVDEVIRITNKYKLVGREMKEDDTVIKIGDCKIGGGNISIIAGPCSVESKDQIFDIAGRLKKMGINLLRAGAYKPRTSPYSFQGLKEKGLQYLDDVKKEFGMSIVTEVKDTHTIPIIAEVADVLQIGARNMQNYSLLEEVGKINKPILLKRGMAAKVEDLLLCAEYILAQGNYNVILCERGIITFETSTRNTLDLNSVPVIKKMSHLPIIVDPSHGTGYWDKVTPMSLAAIACGADGLIIEVHNHPDKALSDGAQSLTLERFEKLFSKIKELIPIIKNQELE